MNDRILSLLGICKRAGKLITGADTTIDSIRKSKAKLVIFANDFSKSSKKSVQTAADECNVKTLTMNRSKEEIGFALGKICGVMTTEDKGFADRLEQLIENESGGELYDKYKVKDAAADLGVSNKEIIEILENIAVLQRKQ